MDSLTTYRPGATETGFTSVQTDASTSQALGESGTPNLRMAVSFLFVVMMPDTKIAKIHENLLRYLRKGGILGGILEFVLFFTLFIFVFLNCITPAFCVGPETAELMEQFSGIDQEDVRYYLLEGWKDIGTLIETTQLQKLPKPQIAYDMINSLQGEQLKNLVDSLVLSLVLNQHPGVHDTVLPQIVELGQTLYFRNRELLDEWGNLLLTISMQKAIVIPQALCWSETAQSLLLLNLSPELTARLANQLLCRALPLSDAYFAFFDNIPRTPELVSEMIKTPRINPYIDAGALKEITRFKRTCQLLFWFTRGQKQKKQARPLKRRKQQGG